MFTMLRRARLRGLFEGLVQKVRAEATENDGKDAVERFQDYGFAANPVEGQGLVLHWEGHTIVLRMDRMAERPRLGAYEVSVWHKEGHHVTLRAGRLVEVECDDFLLKAANSATVETKTFTVRASQKIRNETPLDQVTGIQQPQQLTVGGISGPGSATMVGGSWSMTGVSWSATNCQTAYTGGTLTMNGKDLSDQHRHGLVQRGTDDSGAVS
ncbi:MAG: phage baseplate assembly protein [Pseudacidovorax sp.]|uniref:phage baseplate assembly protein domain-containing protein n=1 Tax=Pseudacidovorax sp. TaxID=1934311 RepID=UPI001B535911|nr:phage baseplate assembly protein [Pseudacidovorax sp.]MBP6897374.1 phage baseplate assembly protein [Pseudacidovorax sp.]